MRKGSKNNICDVNGVRVGHQTRSDGNIQTGVTVILPSMGNIFQEKYPAACHVINGFGKTTGLIQIEELGTLESPIALTNTLSVGTVQQALVKYMLQMKGNEEIGRLTGTINTVVGECNDGYLNDIRACAITEEDVFQAIEHATQEFALGSVGAGRGMSCFQMKGGIGSSSRMITMDEQDYTIGALVLSNFGLQKDFLLDHIGYTDLITDEEQERGSIIIVLACDLPLDARQLKRLCKRMSAALARCGSHLGNGSGDIAIAFSTANIIPHQASSSFQMMKVLHEDKIDQVFRAGIAACEEAVLTSLTDNETVTGRDGHIRYSLSDTISRR